MHILLVSPRGFCAGVNRAIECLSLALEKYRAPLYVYHEIVHNRAVVESYREKGVIFIDSLEDAPVGSTLLFSAHGVSPAIRHAAKERGLHTIDATCPLVTRVHAAAARYARSGYQILFIGHAGHEEVQGTIGEAPEAIHLIEKIEDIDYLSFSRETPLIYLTQTTLSLSEAERIITCLREKFPWMENPSHESICYATSNRQKAVQELSGEVNRVLIVGSSNSSNSRRLAEIAAAEGVPSHLIDGPQDIQLEWFSPDEKVLLSAGASAPECLVQGCMELLRKEFHATFEERLFCEETLQFSLPHILRK